MKALLLLALIVPCLFVGCASSMSSETESTLTAAGFRVRTPENAEQQALYNALPAYKLHRASHKGEVFYAYKDEKQGVAYVGDEQANQRYQQMAVQQRIARSQREAAMMNEMAAAQWYGAYYRPYPRYRY
jgi:hypothetical protein